MKRGVRFAALLVMIVMVMLSTVGCQVLFGGLDAQGYVQAILDQTMKGDVEKALEMTDGTTELALMMQYEEGIDSFVKGNIIKGVEVETELAETYKDTCKKIFSGMKYEVQEAEKVGKNEYQVPVKYQASDVFVKFIEATKAEYDALVEKKEDGEYRGTREEIQAKMQKDLLNNSALHLENAYETMEFGEEKTMSIKVSKNADGLYQLDEAQIAEFLKKILGLGDSL